MRENKQVLCIRGMDLAFLRDQDLADYLGCSRATVWRVANTNKLYKNHIIITIPYETAMALNMRFYEKAYKKRTWIVARGGGNDGSDVWFYDLQEAAEWLNCSRQHISKCIREGKKCKGFIVEKAKMD